jgi:phospholipid-translocating ATPase
MWVLGDLKDQLGITHRRERRKRDIEHVPMFEADYNERSISEIGSIDLPYGETPDARGSYVPAGTQSPGDIGTPHQRPNVDLPPDKNSSRIDVNMGYVVDDSEVWDTVTPVQRIPPEPPLSRVSYYSASDIPPPSPLPDANIYSPTSSRPVTMTSVAINPVTQDYRSSQSLPSHGSLSPYYTPPHTPHSNVNSVRSSHSLPGAAAYPGEYEMRVRSPQRSPQPSQTSHVMQQSETSFFTAHEGSISDHGTMPMQSRDDDTATITAQARGEPGDQDAWRDSISSQATDYTASPHAM